MTMLSVSFLTCFSRLYTQIDNQHLGRDEQPAARGPHAAATLSRTALQRFYILIFKIPTVPRSFIVR
jgi:hypothetical protein